jgi:GDP-L-fucose synthase
MKFNEKIFLAGHKGLVGSAVLRLLKKKGFNNLIIKDKKKLDLVNQKKVNSFFKNEKPEVVILCAAKVGGIYANDTFPKDFIYENLMIQSNVINSSFANGVKKFLFLGSSCIYPKFSRQPIKENYLLTGKLEETNIAYSLAKISGIIMCHSYNRQFKKADFRCLMPTNLYGINDKYDDLNSHVIPALIRRFHFAKIKNLKSVKVWGTGLAKREFLFSDDLAEAVLHTLLLSKKDYYENLLDKTYHLNVGSGKEHTIKQLSNIIAQVVKFKGKIIFDKSKPDGTLRKLLDTSILNKLGWNAKTNLKLGIEKVYKDFISRMN